MIKKKHQEIYEMYRNTTKPQAETNLNISGADIFMKQKPAEKENIPSSQSDLSKSTS